MILFGWQWLVWFGAFLAMLHCVLVFMGNSTPKARGSWEFTPREQSGNLHMKGNGGSHEPVGRMELRYKIIFALCGTVFVVGFACVHILCTTSWFLVCHICLYLYVSFFVLYLVFCCRLCFLQCCSLYIVLLFVFCLLHLFVSLSFSVLLVLLIVGCFLCLFFVEPFAVLCMFLVCSIVSCILHYFCLFFVVSPVRASDIHVLYLAGFVLVLSLWFYWLLVVCYIFYISFDGW